MRQRFIVRPLSWRALRLLVLIANIGSQLTETAPFLDALDRVLMLVDRLAENGIVIEHLDLGGGLGVTYDQEQPPEVADYIAALLARIGDRALKVILEPGRSIAANAGVLLTKVEFLKHNEDKHFAIIDAAMNDLPSPCFIQCVAEYCSSSRSRRRRV